MKENKNKGIFIINTEDKAALKELAEALTPKIIESVKENLQEDKRLTQEEAAQYLRISAPKLKELRDKGHVKFTQIGNQYFYMKSDLKQVNTNISKS